MSFTTSATFSGDGTTKTFTIPFPFLRAGDLSVTVEGVATAFSRPTSSTIQFASAPASGTDNILVERVTDISDPAVDFEDASALFASDLDAQTEQILDYLQELTNTVESLNTTQGGGGAITLPTPGAANRFLVSTDATTWAAKTVAQVQTLLGVDVATTIPAATAGRYFICSKSLTNEWEKNTLADTKTILGIGSYQLPTPTASGMFLTTVAGPAYSLVTSTVARGSLGLGTAAVLNTGTAVGDIPILQSGAYTGSGIGSLPAIGGENLLGVARAPDFEVLYAYGLTRNIASDTTPSHDLSSYGLHTGSWLTYWDAGGGVLYPQLSTGTYKVTVEFRVTGGTGTTFAANLNMDAHGGGAVTPATYGNFGLIAKDATHFITGIFKVTTSYGVPYLSIPGSTGNLTYIRMTLEKFA